LNLNQLIFSAKFERSFTFKHLDLCQAFVTNQIDTDTYIYIPSISYLLKTLYTRCCILEAANQPRPSSAQLAITHWIHNLAVMCLTNQLYIYDIPLHMIFSISEAYEINSPHLLYATQHSLKKSSRNQKITSNRPETSNFIALRHIYTFIGIYTYISCCYQSNNYNKAKGSQIEFLGEYLLLFLSRISIEQNNCW